MTSLILYIRYFFKLDKSNTIIYLFLKVAEAAFFSVETLLIALLLDHTMDNLSDRKQILRNVFLLFGLWMIKRVIEYVGQKKWIRLRRCAYEKLPEMIVEKKKSFSYTTLENKETQELIRRIGTDIEKSFCDYFENSIYLLKSVAEITGLLILLSTKNIWLTLILLIILIPFLFYSIKNGQISYMAYEESEEMFREADYYKSVLNKRNYVEERTLFQYGFFFNKLWSDKYRKAIEVENRANWKVFFRIETSNVVSTIIITGIFLLLACTSVRWSLTIGFLISVMKSLINFIDKVSSDLAKRVSTYEKGILFFRDLKRFNELESESDGEQAENKGTKVERIEFRDVSFTYPGSNQRVFDHLNLTMTKDKHYAIVGENGVGKSTLLKLLMGIYRNYTGIILINGTDIKEMKEVELQNYFAYVPQNVTRYEIALDEYLQEKEVEKINRMFGEYEIGFIKAEADQPMLGKIEEAAVELSGGQWQQLAIVRASLCHKEVIVLDEPTAAIDPIKELKLYSLFQKLMAKKFTILVTHRLGAAKMADEIIVLADGKVVEKGNHAELLGRGKWYSEMYLTQRKWYETDEK